MFKVLSGERKRRIISPATIAASIAAHVLLLGGAVYAAAADSGPRETLDGIVEIKDWVPEPAQPEPVEPAPPPPAPEQPDQPEVPKVPGETLQLEEVTEVPQTITPEPPGTPPVDPRDHSGIGRIGNVIGEPRGEPAEVVPPTPPTPEPAKEWIIDEGTVEERPSLDRNGLARAMERYYPPILRDSRTTGRVVIELVVDTDGRVREGSARIVEASHPAFGEAALRAAERFRFRPGKMAGIPVPVRVTLPIQWTVPR
jgi:protein TonB